MYDTRARRQKFRSFTKIYLFLSQTEVKRVDIKFGHQKELRRAGLFLLSFTSSYRTAHQDGQNLLLTLAWGVPPACRLLLHLYLLPQARMAEHPSSKSSEDFYSPDVSPCTSSYTCSNSGSKRSFQKHRITAVLYTKIKAGNRGVDLNLASLKYAPYYLCTHSYTLSICTHFSHLNFIAKSSLCLQ